MCKTGTHIAYFSFLFFPHLQRLARKMTTFGVDFHKHLKASKRNIPIIVTKCINEIDERGLDTQGLYRISSAKTKLEHLCQLFESGIDRVDLSDRPCHLIGSCLKLYFRQVCVCVYVWEGGKERERGERGGGREGEGGGREGERARVHCVSKIDLFSFLILVLSQLPEPLLTFDLYQEFITFARVSFHLFSPLLFILHLVYCNTALPFTIQEASHILPCKFDSVSEEKAEMARGLIERLKGIIQRLPYQNYITLARLLFHLNRYIVCSCSLLPYICENFC